MTGAAKLAGLVALVVGSSAVMAGAAHAYDPPHPLIRARNDYRSVAGGEDAAAKAQFGSVWRQAEATEDAARRLSLTRIAVSAAARAISQSETKMLTWATEQAKPLASLILDPEVVAGPKSLADEGRRPFYLAADEWNLLHRKLGGKAAKGSVADEYVAATGAVLRELRKVADSGGNVKGRFLLSGFDRLAELDSAKELHRQTKALATGHRGGDKGAADRVRELGWGASGAPTDVAGALADLEGYRQSVTKFRAEVEVAAAAPVGAPATAVGPAAAAAPAPAVAAQSVGAAAIELAIDQEASLLATPLPAGGLYGWMVFRQGLADTGVAVRGADGQILIPPTGGLALPPGLLGDIAPRLKAPATPEDLTAKRFGRILGAWTATARADLDKAINEGELKDAVRIYAGITGEAEDRVEERVKALSARRQSGDQVAKVLAKAPTSEQLLKSIPAGPDVIPPDEDYLRDAPNLGELSGDDAALPAVAAYLPPPPRADGEQGGDDRVAWAHAQALAQAQAEAGAAAKAFGDKAAAAQAEAEAHATAQRQVHLDSLREAAFGAIPESCPDGEEVSLCPEKHVIKTHPGRCRPAGLSCDVPGVVNLAFP